ncbi:TauD/TfdA family dioxygenase [Rhizobium sp. ZPR3]|uniref:TauD/TfdA family dioxygenase n=2 Tax=unclassified Rhizobium TaxID=2613769 RepID=A0AAU7S9G4_9HYPH
MQHTSINEPFETVAGWRSRDVADPKLWTYQITSEEKDEIETAFKIVRNLDKSFHDLTTSDFPLPRFGKRLRELTDALESGLGFTVIKGLPIVDKTEDEARLISWGIGLYIGIGLPQNDSGTLIHDVRDRGETSQKTLRGNGSSEEIQFHIDPCDIVGLFCRRAAAKGGGSKLCSSVEICQRIAAEEPRLFEQLRSIVPFAALGASEDSVRVYYVPVFGWHKGAFTSHYYRARIIKASSLPSVSLSDEQRAAVDLVQTMASDPEMHMEMQLEPGDLQLVNNHIVYHSRTAYEDHEDFDRRRHLFRFWFSVPGSRELPAEFANVWGKTTAGSVRGGVRLWDGKFDVVDRYQERMAGLHNMSL